jgi:hypothetical protein
MNQQDIDAALREHDDWEQQKAEQFGFDEGDEDHED